MISPCLTSPVILSCYFPYNSLLAASSLLHHRLKVCYCCCYLC